MAQERDKPIMGTQNLGWGMPSRLTKSVIHLHEAAQRQMEQQQKQQKKETETQEAQRVEPSATAELR